MHNNPFMYSYPYIASNLAKPAVGRGLLGGIKSINWGGILTNTQKTLGIINQAIPIVYQVKPIVNNAKTMFKIANTIKDNDQRVVKKENDIQENDIQKNNISMDTFNNGKPIFFI